MGAVLLHGLMPPSIAPQGNAPDHSLLDCGEFCAVISPAPAGFAALDTDATAQLALRHHAILAAYCPGSGVLPMRFGTAFSSPTAARMQLLRQATEHKNALQLLGLACEFILRLVIAGDPPIPDRAVTSGRDFLTRGRDLRDRRTNLAAARLTLGRSLLAATVPLARQIEAASAPRPERLIDVALLADPPAHARLAALCATQTEAAAALGMVLTLTGPWPAYSFKPPVMEDAHGA